ncbi:hypothetical protein, partial [Neisseria mucosa]|uniref:hypothetical protein n=1 Tax=Neisseria mucosa TaxID=488 RepID=UPI0027DFFF86
GNHGLCGLLEEGAHGKSPKCLDGNLGDLGEFCKGLGLTAGPTFPAINFLSTKYKKQIGLTPPLCSQRHHFPFIFKRLP